MEPEYSVSELMGSKITTPSHPSTSSAIPCASNNIPDPIDYEICVAELLELEISSPPEPTTPTTPTSPTTPHSNHSNSTSSPQTTSKKLSNLQRQRIIEILLQNSNHGSLPRGLVNQTAEEFNISRRTVSTLWALAKKQLNEGVAIDVRSRLAGRVGRPREESDVSKITELDFRVRSNIRSLAAHMGYPKSTIHRLVKRGTIKSHSNAIKPTLTAENKIKRLESCLSKLAGNSIMQNPIFGDLYDHIHIDEKWFFMTQTSQKYYLHPNKIEPHREIQSKRFITKVMFLAAVTRPRISNGEVQFDGKIDIFPFTVIEPAKRKSKNRSRGVLETKPILSITKEVYRECLIQNVIPAIKAKWLASASRRIFIQQDNARPHIHPHDPANLAL